jgi:hypothetical protein
MSESGARSDFLVATAGMAGALAVARLNARVLLVEILR